jgi:site-specific recombinase XerD
VGVGGVITSRHDMIRATPARRWRLKLSKAITEFIADLPATGKAKATIDAYASDLQRLFARAGHDTVLNVTPDLIRHHFRDLSEEGFALSTLHRKAATFREFIKWGRRQRIWPAELALDLIDAVPKIVRQEPIPRPFTRAETARIWKLDLPTDQRVLRSLLFFTGLRVTGICQITIGRVSQDPPAIITRNKGGRDVVKHLHPRLAEILFSYILSRTDLKPESALLLRPSGYRMTRRYIEDLTKAWGRAANVPNCLPHRFRHTFATEQLRRGVDIRVIQKTLDHKSLKSTEVYTRVHDDQIQAAIEKLPDSWGD